MTATTTTATSSAGGAGPGGVGGQGSSGHDDDDTAVGAPGDDDADYDPSTASSPSKRQRKVHEDATDNDAFLSSMTFARMTSRPDCDCDECGGLCGDPLPPEIADAVRRYKRAKLVSSLWDGGSTVEPVQERELVARESAVVASGEVANVAVWRWTLPPGAKPLVEYGNTDRILFVESMPEGSKLVSIGRGILGSSDEERDRIDVPWRSEGDAYLLPSNGGRAMGWIHVGERGGRDEDAVGGKVGGGGGDDDGGDGGDGGNVVLVMVKVTTTPAPAGTTAAGGNDTPKKEIDDDGDACWVRRIASVFRRNMIAGPGGITTPRSSSAHDGSPASPSGGRAGFDGKSGDCDGIGGPQTSIGFEEDERVGIALGEDDRAIVRDVVHRVTHG